MNAIMISNKNNVRDREIAWLGSKRHLEESKSLFNIFVRVIRPNEILIPAYYLWVVGKLTPPDSIYIFSCNNTIDRFVRVCGSLTPKQALLFVYATMAGGSLRTCARKSFQFIFCCIVAAVQDASLGNLGSQPNGAIGVPHNKIIGPLSFYYC